MGRVNIGSNGAHKHTAAALFAVLALIAVFAADRAAAQQAQTAEAEAIDEIIITATRRETTLQEAPVAISAFDQAALERASVNDLRDVDLLTPNLFIGGNAGFGTTPIAIRGIGSLVLGVGADEGVGVYVDGIFQGRGTGMVFEFVDIERVEVLRGPQGTLYGRNATGGAINIVTLTPRDDFTARIEAELTDYDGVGVRGYVMTPVTDSLSLKVAGGSFDRDGFQFNPTRDEFVSAVDKSYFSAALNWTPGERTGVVLKGYHANTDTPISFKNLNDGAGLDTVLSDFQDFDQREMTSFNLTLDRDFGPVQGKALLGWLETEVRSRTDSDGLAVDNVQLRDTESSDQASAELQLSSSGEGRVNWLLGAFLFREDAEVFLPFNFFRTLPGGPVGLIFAAEAETEAYAGFGEVYVDLTERLKLTAGLRYSTEDKDWRGCVGGFFSLFEVDFDPNGCAGAFVPDDDSFDAVTPRVVLDYTVSDDLLVYASATRGFRSGGWNFTEATLPGVNNGFDEEFVWSYEAGVKAELFERRVRLNAAAFTADYEDLQTRTPDASGFLQVSNAGSATINGVEIELAAVLGDGWSIDGSLSWLDATYDELTFQGILDFQNKDGAGNDLNRAPEWQGALAVSYAFDLAEGGSFRPRLEWQHNGELFHSPDNLQPFGSEAFDIVNLRLRYDAAGEAWGIEGYVENLTDERYREHTFQGILPSILPAIISEPRIWGVRAFAGF